MKKLLYKRTYVAPPANCEICNQKFERLEVVRSGCPSLGWVYYYACVKCIEEIVMKGRNNIIETAKSKGVILEERKPEFDELVEVDVGGKDEEEEKMG